MENKIKNELYTLYDEGDKNGKIDVDARTGSLQEAGFLTPEGTRSVGKPSMRWLESVEEDLKNTGVRNWRRK
jgi:hypothetical protein